MFDYEAIVRLVNQKTANFSEVVKISLNQDLPKLQEIIELHHAVLNSTKVLETPDEESQLKILSYVSDVEVKLREEFSQLINEYFCSYPPITLVYGARAEHTTEMIGVLATIERLDLPIAIGVCRQAKNQYDVYRSELTETLIYALREDAEQFYVFTHVLKPNNRVSHGSKEKLREFVRQTIHLVKFENVKQSTLKGLLSEDCIPNNLYPQLTMVENATEWGLFPTEVARIVYQEFGNYTRRGYLNSTKETEETLLNGITPEYKTLSDKINTVVREMSVHSVRGHLTTSTINILELALQGDTSVFTILASKAIQNKDILYIITKLQKNEQILLPDLLRIPDTLISSEILRNSSQSDEYSHINVLNTISTKGINKDRLTVANFIDILQNIKAMQDKYRDGISKSTSESISVASILSQFLPPEVYDKYIKKMDGRKMYLHALKYLEEVTRMSKVEAAMGSNKVSDELKAYLDAILLGDNQGVHDLALAVKATGVIKEEDLLALGEAVGYVYRYRTNKYDVEAFEWLNENDYIVEEVKGVDLQDIFAMLEECREMYKRLVPILKELPTVSQELYESRGLKIPNGYADSVSTVFYEYVNNREQEYYTNEILTGIIQLGMLLQSNKGKQDNSEALEKEVAKFPYLKHIMSYVESLLPVKPLVPVFKVEKEEENFTASVLFKKESKKLDLTEEVVEWITVTPFIDEDTPLSVDDFKAKLQSELNVVQHVQNIVSRQSTLELDGLLALRGRIVDRLGERIVKTVLFDKFTKEIEAVEGASRAFEILNRNLVGGHRLNPDDIRFLGLAEEYVSFYMVEPLLFKEFMVYYQNSWTEETKKRFNILANLIAKASTDEYIVTLDDKQALLNFTMLPSYSQLEYDLGISKATIDISNLQETEEVKENKGTVPLNKLTAFNEKSKTDSGVLLSTLFSFEWLTEEAYQNVKNSEAYFIEHLESIESHLGGSLLAYEHDTVQRVLILLDSSYDVLHNKKGVVPTELLEEIKDAKLHGAVYKLINSKTKANLVRLSEEGVLKSISDASNVVQYTTKPDGSLEVEAVDGVVTIPATQLRRGKYTHIVASFGDYIIVMSRKAVALQNLISMQASLVVRSTLVNNRITLRVYAKIEATEKEIKRFKGYVTLEIPRGKLLEGEYMLNSLGGSSVYVPHQKFQDTLVLKILRTGDITCMSSESTSQNPIDLLVSKGLMVRVSDNPVIDCKIPMLPINALTTVATLLGTGSKELEVLGVGSLVQLLEYEALDSKMQDIFIDTKYNPLENYHMLEYLAPLAYFSTVSSSIELTGVEEELSGNANIINEILRNNQKSVAMSSQHITREHFASILLCVSKELGYL